MVARRVKTVRNGCRRQRRRPMSDPDQAKDDGAIDSSPSKTLPPNGAAPASAPRRALRSGRFARWHLEPATVPEEDGWFLTYLDLITLLLTMMVVMLSFAGPGSQGAPVSTATGAAPST